LASSILGGVIMKIYDTCPRMALTNHCAEQGFLAVNGSSLALKGRGW
jgi:riboflavin synthase alpha subunit